MNEPTLSAAEYVDLGTDILEEVHLLNAAIHDLFVERVMAVSHVRPGSVRSWSLAELLKKCDLKKIEARTQVLSTDTTKVTEEDFVEFRAKRLALERAIAAFRAARGAVAHG